jgi:hypothetical protein
MTAKADQSRSRAMTKAVLPNVMLKPDMRLDRDSADQEITARTGPAKTQLTKDQRIESADLTMDTLHIV